MATLTADQTLLVSSAPQVLPPNTVKIKGDSYSVILVGAHLPTPPIETWSSSK